MNITTGELTISGVLEPLNRVTEVEVTIEEPMDEPTHETVHCEFCDLDPWREGQAPHRISWNESAEQLRDLIAYLRIKEVRFSLQLKLEA